MTDPHVEVFTWPGGWEVASVVVDVEDFDALCEELRGIMVIHVDKKANERAADIQIEALKAAQHVPMVARGEKTKFLFERYNIEQDRMCIIVRGKGPKLLKDLMDRDQASLN
jgi:hypothetical protein